MPCLTHFVCCFLSIYNLLFQLAYDNNFASPTCGVYAINERKLAHKNSTFRMKVSLEQFTSKISYNKYTILFGFVYVNLLVRLDIVTLLNASHCCCSSKKPVLKRMYGDAKIANTRSDNRKMMTLNWSNLDDSIIWAQIRLYHTFYLSNGT